MPQCQRKRVSLWRRRITSAALCVALHSAYAAEEPTLDQLLEGFDETPAQQQSNTPLDELLEGFDDAPPTVKDVASPPATARSWHINGFTTLSASYNYQHPKPALNETDFRGLSRLRWTAQPEISIDLAQSWKAFVSARGFYDFAYAINGREQYRYTYLNSYEHELRLREAYVSGRLNEKVDLKLGRQIVVWGKSDSIRVVDVLNPLDLREPGLVDIEGLRLPVTMLRGDYFLGNWSITALAIPEIAANKMPVIGSDFFPGNKTVAEDKPTSSLENTEYALALSGIFSGWDLSFHAADFYDDNAYFVKGPTGPRLRKYARLHMLGTATNVALGSWIIKSELAYVDGLHFANITDHTFSRVDWMVGIDYSGITNHTVSLEAVARRITKYDAALSAGPDEQKRVVDQLALRYTGNFMRERLQLVLLASLFGLTDDLGGFYRASLDFDIRDAWSVNGGLVAYQAGATSYFDAIARNDRVFIETRFDF